jgi:hypothetical protein
MVDSCCDVWLVESNGRSPGTRASEPPGFAACIVCCRLSLFCAQRVTPAIWPIKSTPTLTPATAPAPHRPPGHSCQTPVLPSPRPNKIKCHLLAKSPAHPQFPTSDRAARAASLSGTYSNRVRPISPPSAVSFPVVTSTYRLGCKRFGLSIFSHQHHQHILQPPTFTSNAVLEGVFQQPVDRDGLLRQSAA